MAKSNKIFITEHVLELKHAAAGKFLDVRGEVADYIKKENLFVHWGIRENTISFYEEEGIPNKPKAMIGFNSIVFVAPNPATQNFFQEKAICFWNIVKKNKFYIVPKISRFGSRTKCYIPADNMTFDNIYKNMCSKLFHNDFMKQTRTSTDLQLVLDLKEEGYNIRLVLGPVRERESARYFSFDTKEFAKSGLYIDIDCFKNGNIAHDEIKTFLDKAMKLTWAKIDTVVDFIGV